LEQSCSFIYVKYEVRGGAVGEALRYKSEGSVSIPDGIIGIFHWCNPSSRTMALGGTQPLTERNIRNISWGKGGWCVNLTSQLSCANHLEIWACNRPVQGLLELFVKYWTEISIFEGILQLYRCNSRKMCRITTNFVRYVFRIMNSHLFTNPSFSQNIFKPYWTQCQLSF